MIGRGFIIFTAAFLCVAFPFCILRAAAAEIPVAKPRVSTEPATAIQRNTGARPPIVRNNLPARSQGATTTLSAEEWGKIRALIHQLGAEEFKTREAAERTLTDMGDQILPQLRSAASYNPDPEIRECCERILFKKYWHISASLWDKLGDIRPLFENPKDNSRERNLMAQRLLNIDNDDALAFASRLLEADYSHELKISTYNLSQDLGRRGVKAFELVRQWKNPSNVYGFVSRYMDVQNDFELDKAILDYLSSQACSERYRGLLLYEFSCQKDQRKLMPVYLLAMDSEEKYVRDESVFMCARIIYCDFGYDRNAPPGDKKAIIQQIKTFWEENEDKSEQELIRHAATCDVNSVESRVAAIRKLAQTKDASVNEQLHKYVAEKEKGLGWTTASALYALGDKIGVQKCLDALKGSDDKEIYNAVVICAEIMKEDVLQGALVVAFKNQALSGYTRGVIFGHIDKSRRPDLLDTLRNILKDKTSDAGLRGDALEYIFEMNPQEGEQLARNVLDDKDDHWNVHCAAIVVLRTAGGKKHLDKVVPYLDSDNMLVRFNAVIAIYLLAGGDASIVRVGFENYRKNEQEYLAKAGQLAKKAMETGEDNAKPSP